MLDRLLPGWRSSFILHRFDGVVVQRDDCIVVRTPANPLYYWGNFLLLPEAPRDEHLAHWRARFEEEITALQPDSLHVAIGVNQARGLPSLPSWQLDGFELLDDAALRLEPGQLKPPRPPKGRIEFRALDLERERDAVVALQCADDHGLDQAGFAEHRQRQMARYAAMARRGQAAWFGVWCDGVLAADCGLMRADPADGDVFEGRFQHVSTHPAWRRRGLCSALIHGVSAWGFANWGLRSLLMCADPHDVAIGIYESLGYRRVSSEWRLQRLAPRDAAARAAGPA
jgi:ribosomal protein S18 acetylase RimI-like enzyme